jgi:hypothetical protein
VHIGRRPVTGRRRGLAAGWAATLLILATATGCGETTNEQDGRILERFAEDPLFDLEPAGATKDRDYQLPGSPWRSEAVTGDDNVRAVGWTGSTEAPATLAKRYLDELMDHGWNEITVECDAEPSARAHAFGLDASRVSGEVIDAVRVIIAKQEDGTTDLSVVMSAPFHSDDPYPAPDPSAEPDIRCPDEARASS